MRAVGVYVKDVENQDEWKFTQIFGRRAKKKLYDYLVKPVVPINTESLMLGKY